MQRALLCCLLLLLGLTCQGVQARAGRTTLELRTAAAPAPAPSGVPTDALPFGRGTSGPVRVHWRHDINRTARSPSLPSDPVSNAKLQADEKISVLGQGQAAKEASIQWPGLGGLGAGKVQYHGGPLLTGTLTVHVIYYGNWPANSGQSVLEGFVKSLSSSAADGEGPSVHKWWEIATQYKDSSGTPVASNVVFGKSVAVGGRYKAVLGDGMDGGTNDIQTVVEDQILSGALPLDSGAFYAVLTSGDVRVGSASSGFCGTQGYCGWHMQASVQGAPVRFAMVGDGTQQCPQGCGQNAGYSATPNGYQAMDSLVSTFAHELAEAATNPDTATGYWALADDGQSTEENGDLCVGQYTDSTYPNLMSDAGGTYGYNLVGVGGLKFLVQTNVDLGTQSCVLQGSSAAAGGAPGASPPTDASAPPPSDPSGGSFAPSPSDTNPFLTPSSNFNWGSGFGGGPANAPSPGASSTGGGAFPPETSAGGALPPAGSLGEWNTPGSSDGPDGTGYTPGSADGPDGTGYTPGSADGPGYGDWNGDGDGWEGAFPPGAAEAPAGSERSCEGRDFDSCSDCSSPDGCRCLQGSCQPLCQVAASAGFAEPCSSCGAQLCTCGTGGSCMGPAPSSLSSLWDWMFGQ